MKAPGILLATRAWFRPCNWTYYLSITFLLLQGCSSGTKWESPLEASDQPIIINTSKSYVTLGRFRVIGSHDTHEQKTNGEMIEGLLNNAKIDLDSVLLESFIENIGHLKQFSLSDSDGSSLQIRLESYGYLKSPLLPIHNKSRLDPYLLAHIAIVDQSGKVQYSKICYQSKNVSSPLSPTIDQIYYSPSLAEQSWRELTAKTVEALFNLGCNRFGNITKPSIY